MRNLLFGTYMSYDEAPADRVYDEVDDIRSFKKIVKKCLKEYNSFSKSPMDMVIFRYDSIFFFFNFPYFQDFIVFLK